MHNSPFPENWAGRLTGLLERLRPQFARQDLFRRAAQYIQGLLSQVERKNSWQLAEAVGNETPHSLQRLLGRARWEADAVREELGHYVNEQVGASSGVLIVDETGFVKKGPKSAGVARQYSGTAGRIENCQGGVFLAYRSDRGHALMERELYVPKGWIDDESRCKEAGIPEETKFATKPVLARRMLQRAFDAGLPAQWVTADEVYGSDSHFRRFLEHQGRGSVVAISCQHRLFLTGQYDRVDRHVQTFPNRAWKKLSCGAGTKGQRWYEWAFVPFGARTAKGLRKGCLVRRCRQNPAERAYYLTHAPGGTPLKTLVHVAGARWAIEECFEQAKQETGLDEYEVRSVRSGDDELGE